MNTADMPAVIMRRILTDQQNEINAWLIYTRTAKLVKDKKNAEVLTRIAEHELAHYRKLLRITGRELKPQYAKVRVFLLLTRLFGITFGLKLLERDESKAAGIDYAGLDAYIPGLPEIVRQEEEHEAELLGMIHEQRLDYLGSVVLGLNDALVELTGTLAGLSFAFQNTRIIALSGLITGIAASFSMAASEYLSSRTDGAKEPLKSAIYTGIAYIITVFLLILPFLIFSHYLVCLAVTLAVSVLIILLFNYYIAVAKDYSFSKRFGEMALISLGVAAFSFGIGAAVRLIFNVEI